MVSENIGSENDSGRKNLPSNAQSLMDVLQNDQNMTGNFKKVVIAKLEKFSEEHKKIFIAKLDEAQRKLEELLNVSVVCKRITEKSLLKALGEGNFKSQFENSDEEGTGDTFSKSRIEHKLFGIGKEYPNKDRPKYGYISDISGRGCEDMYGNIVILFKEGVRNQTTITEDDSANTNFYPSTLSHPSIFSFLPKGFYEVLTGDSPEKDIEILEKILAICNKIINKENLLELHYVIFGSRYIEAQIHGELKTNQIEKIFLPLESSTEIIEKIKQLRIPYELKKI